MSTQSPYAFKSVGDEPKYIRDLPPEEQQRLILSGQTTAGPLSVLMVKYPLTFWTIVATLGTGAFIWGCVTAIQV